MQSPRSLQVTLWGTPVGFLHQESNGLIGFQYDKAFLQSGIQIAPLKMPLSGRTYVFSALPENTFKGLPGMLADSLPDKFGNIVMKKWLEAQGRSEDSLSVIEKLCYTGKRGMGALEYEPSYNIGISSNELVNIDALSKLASDILSEKESIRIKADDRMMSQLMECGSSAGGARAKTLIAWNKEKNEIRLGQINAGDGYEYWLLKFGNIKNNKDKDETPDSTEYTKIEYAYYLMAKAAGIEMSECQLYKENGISHFMTKRFDRIPGTGEKLHMQSLCAIAHMDFCAPRTFSYDEAFSVMRKLQLSYQEHLQLYKRMVFNEYAKNFDDHTKNISFLMDKMGKWSLAPAYDMTFSFKSDSIWVNSHQMLINGKADNISEEDLLLVAKRSGIKRRDALSAIEQTIHAVSLWLQFAEQAQLSEQDAQKINSLLSANYS